MLIEYTANIARMWELGPKSSRMSHASTLHLPFLRHGKVNNMQNLLALEPLPT
jgi:hypothetical protein